MKFINMDNYERSNIGANAKARVEDFFLVDNVLNQYVNVLSGNKKL